MPGTERSARHHGFVLRQNNKSAPAAGKEEGETGCDGPRVNNEEGADTCTEDTDTQLAQRTLGPWWTEWTVWSGHIQRGTWKVQTHRGLDQGGKLGSKRDTLMWTQSHTHSLGRWAHLDSCRPKFYCLACSDLNLRRVGQNQQTCDEYIYFQLFHFTVGPSPLHAFPMRIGKAIFDNFIPLPFGSWIWIGCAFLAQTDNK